MKKNFFKKLSFVLALAMIVSVIAPASGVFAATKAPKLNKTKVYLYLEQDKKDVFDFNVSNKSGNSVEYVSADEDVATVDEMGVTEAVGVGRTTITATLYNKKGVEVKSLKATVVVRDNIAELEVSNLPSGKVKIGEPHDFDVTYTTVAGYNDGTSSYVAWEVLKDGKATEAATIDKDGKFVATEAGKYEVIARAFQTVDGYKLFADGKEANILDEAKAEVEVAVSISDVKLVTPKQIQITFDSSVKDVVKTAADVKVDRKLTGTFTAMVPVWSLDSVSEDGKVVLVSTYDNLADKETYVITAAGATTELYAQIGKPVEIKMDDQVIPANTPTELKYELLDQYGVNVKDVYDKSSNLSKLSSVPFGADGKLSLGADQVAFVEYSYLIVNEDGSVKTISTGRKTIKGVAATLGSTLEWTIGSSDFSKIENSIKVGESKIIYGRVKMSNGNYTNSANYRYESLNTSILAIDYSTSTLIPLNAGTALVKVTDITNNAYVAYINVEVKAAPATVSIKASTNAVKLSNDIAGTTAGVESVTVTISQIDQYNTETAVSSIQSRYFLASDRNNSEFVTVSATGNAITFTAVAGKTGTVNYYVKAADKELTINVTVLTPGTLVNYAVTTSVDSIDSYVANPDTVSALDITVYGVDANGTKKELVKDLSTTSGVAVKYSITNPDGTKVVDNVTFNGAATYSVNDTISAVKTGTYTITVSIGGINYTKTFEVKNTRTGATKSNKALSVEVTNATADVKDAVLGLIEVKVGDHVVTVSEVTAVEFISLNSAIVTSNAADFTTTGTVSLYIQKIKFTYGGYDYEVAVNATYTVVVK